MKISKLSKEDIASELKLLDGWDLKNGKLFKSFKFKDFPSAIQFMVGVSFECEKLNHHPQWYNVYGLVQVELITHSVNGLTELDFKLARKMDVVAVNLIR